MNNPNENNSSPIEEKSKRGYIVTIGRDHFRVINIYVGTKSASKAIQFMMQQSRKFFTMLKIICRETANIVMSIFDACCRKLS